LHPLCYKLAADQGHADAQAKYGNFVVNRKGSERKDLEAAVRYFKLSANQGNADGQNCYGFCLEFAKGVPIHLKAAAY
jgi:TPR repeat protein